ncbi:MAG: polynucleotide adenylyltransferase PcnB [Nevskiales bacterium]|nr:polynucleotide adenylyltransferase PcnB [Nevskiales bacterium]
MLDTLQEAGFEAYVVGGGVRDLLTGLKPKDFDVATDARPEQIRRLFRSCRLVGRRFMIAHVRFGHETVEVTTFRGPISDTHERDATGRILSDNVYGTLEDDAFRRDFTVNALYYDARSGIIVDYVGGLEDLRNRTLRLIGEPESRYREDAVRMLRAVRIGNKLHFRLDPACIEPMQRLAPLLREIPPARLFDEILKLLLNPDAVENFRALHWLHLWQALFPEVDAALEREPERTRAFIERALAGAAERLHQGLPVSPAFLFAALLWVPVQARARDLAERQGHPLFVALQQATEELMTRQALRIAMPKRFSVPAREIWQLQPRFEQRRGGRPQRFLAHPRFRAAYDFLLLRHRSGESLQESVDWWTAAQQGVPSPMADSASPVVHGQRRRRRRRSRRGAHPGPEPQS